MRRIPKAWIGGSREPAVIVPIATGWAVVRADGSLLVDLSAGAIEDSPWHTGLPMGWRIADKTIEEAKSRGARAFRCEVREINDNSTEGAS
jgi:hypothetical protein